MKYKKEIFDITDLGYGTLIIYTDNTFEVLPVSAPVYEIRIPKDPDLLFGSRATAAPNNTTINANQR